MSTLLLKCETPRQAGPADRTLGERVAQHQERLEGVRRKSEITRRQNLMEHEEVLENVAGNMVVAVQKRVEQDPQEREEEEMRQTDEDLLLPRRRKLRAAD
jgi:hypothetical protein